MGYFVSKATETLFYLLGAFETLVRAWKPFLSIQPQKVRRSCPTKVLALHSDVLPEGQRRRLRLHLPRSR